MKLTARDSDAFLKAPDKQAAAVLLYGPDSGLVRERSRAIATQIIGKDADPLCRMDLTNDQIKSDPAILRDELSALSLMGGRRVITIRDASDKIAPIIESAFEGLHTTTYLIVEAEELSPAAGLRQLFEKEPRFAALPCYRDEGRNLEEVIRTGFTAHGLRAHNDAVHYLSQHMGNDRGVTHSEIDKIALYMGTEKEVTLELAVQLTGHNASQSMEDLCHAVASGNSKDAHAYLTQLLHEGVQPVTIIRSLLKHFQRLEVAKAHITAGASLDQTVAGLRPPVFFKYVPVVKRELSSLQARTLSQILNLLLRAEKDLKSSLLSPHLLASQTVQMVAGVCAK